MDHHTQAQPDSVFHGKFYLYIRRIVRSRASFLIKPWTALKRLIWLMLYPNPAIRFAKIYETNYWANGESRSGEGSTSEATRDVRHALETFILEHRVDSMLDVPCGDFNWMQHADIRIPYIGGDIVEALIIRNRDIHGRNGRAFEVIDLARTNLPRCALVFTRDCFNHLSIAEIQLAIANVSGSRAEYIAVTQFSEQTVNRDQESGFKYRELNFLIYPFNWPSPLAIFSEGSHPGKQIGFWKVAALPLPRN